MIHRLIDEIIELNEYLDGKNIRKNNLYRICYLISKYNHARGMSKLDSRDALFEWGKKFGVYIKYNVNSIINAAFEDKTNLYSGDVVKVSVADMKEILRRFDNKKNRISALAVLCYAKVRANEYGEFSLSSNAFASWLGVGSTSAFYYLRDMCEYEYLERIYTPSNNYLWAKNDDMKSCRYKILVSTDNNGEFTLFQNDIEDLYNTVMDSI